MMEKMLQKRIFKPYDFNKKKDSENDDKSVSRSKSRNQTSYMDEGDYMSFNDILRKNIDEENLHHSMYFEVKIGQNNRIKTMS